MIRARFKTDAEDWRPVNWPLKHPYWCAGYNDTYAVMVAYADDLDELLGNWPEATDVVTEPVEKYEFNRRFPKPDWFVEQDSGA